jgi:hypothetical protein
MKLAISPRQCLRGTATQFEVVRVIYSPDGSATADCQLYSADDKLVDGLVVNATPAQTAAWTDDADFYAVLAVNAGLTPV